MEFYLGNIEVGRALCGKVITPVDLIRNAESADDKRVVRIAVFLQSVNTGDDKERKANPSCIDNRHTQH